MAQPNTFRWALGFFAIYLLVQLVVSYHPLFRQFTPIKKSITVKATALSVFAVLYILAALI